MTVNFEKEYLLELYRDNKASDKKYIYQPQIIKRYVKVIDIMKFEEDINGLQKYGSLHYEHIHGDKEGISSVRVNNQYRIEFTEATEEGKTITTICNIIELSNHYQ